MELTLYTDKHLALFRLLIRVGKKQDHEADAIIERFMACDPVAVHLVSELIEQAYQEDLSNEEEVKA